MNRIFVIADTHFGHKKALSFRPFETLADHDDYMVTQWNSVVKPKDTVWHLGDVLFGPDSFEILGKLNGRKKLVMGNHDGYPTSRYLEHFSQVVGAAVLHGVILTHIPIHPGQFSRFARNIHGHLHTTVIDDPRYINVSVEQINYTPVPLADLVD